MKVSNDLFSFFFCGLLLFFFFFVYSIFNPNGIHLLGVFFLKKKQFSKTIYKQTLSLQVIYSVKHT